jgi:hypothetical protein
VPRDGVRCCRASAGLRPAVRRALRVAAARAARLLSFSSSLLCAGGYGISSGLVADRGGGPVVSR